MEPVKLESLMSSGSGNATEASQLNRELDKLIGKAEDLGNIIQSVQKQLSSISGNTRVKLGVELDFADKSLQEEKGKLETMSRVLNGLTGAVKLSTGAAKLLGVERERLAEIEVKLQAITQITNGVQQVATALTGKDVTITSILIGAKNLLTAANARLAVALGISTVAAQALMATLTMGLSVAITGLVLLMNRQSEAQEKSRQQQELATEQAKKQAEAEERLRTTVAGNVATQMVEYKKLQMQYNALGDDMKKKQQFVKDNQEAFKKLGVSVGSVTDAEQLLVKNEAVYVASLRKRALMAASMEMAAEKYKKAIVKMMEADKSKEKANDPEASQFRKNLALFDSKQLIKQGQILQQEAEQAVTTSLTMGKALAEELAKAGINPDWGTTIANAVPQEKVENRLNEYALAAEQKLEEQKLALMAEGTEKRKVIADREYREELARIDEERTAVLAHYEALKKAGESVPDEVIQHIITVYEQQEVQTDAIHQGNMDSINSDVLKQQQEEIKRLEQQIQEIQNKYASFATKQLQIDARYNSEANLLLRGMLNARTDAERKQINDSIILLEKRREAEKNSLDKQQESEAETILKNTDTWKQLAADASKESVGSINDILDKGQQLLDFLEKKPGAKLPEGIDYDEQYNGQLQNDDALIKELKALLSQRTNDLSSKNPFEGFINRSDKLFDAFKKGDSKEALTQIEGLEASFKQATAYLDQMGKSLGQVFGEDTGYAIDQAMALGKSVFDIGSGAARMMSGDILGGITGMVSGIGSLFSMGKKVKAENAKVRKQVEDNERKAYLAEYTINELYRQRYEWSKKIGESTLANLARQGEELERQSAANEKEQNELWEKLMGTQYKESETYRHGTLFRKAKIITEWGSLSGKSWEDIELLAEAGKLSEEGKQYYEALKKAKEEGEDLAQRQEEFLEQVRETFTGSSYDSFVSSIVEGFKAGKRSASDFADSFEELMKGAVLASVQLMADDKARKFYEEWSELAGDDDGLTAKDIETLRNKYQQMMQEITNEGTQLEQITGIDVMEGGQEQQGAQTGTFTTMTQEQGTKLEGLFTSLQDHVIGVDDKMTDMSVVMYDSFDALNRIADNTSYLAGMAEDINEMKRDGVKMK